MMTIFHDQAEFLKAGDIPFPSNTYGEELAINLIQEEYKEFMQCGKFFAFKEFNSLKECIDLIYVCAQYMNACVGPTKAAELWSAVHHNNMSKCIDGKLVKRADGKIMKPFNYKAITEDYIKHIIEG